MHNPDGADWASSDRCAVRGNRNPRISEKKISANFQNNKYLYYKFYNNIQ